jgi:hypothetical protein
MVRTRSAAYLARYSFALGAPLAGHHVQPVESAGDPLRVRGVGQEVARDLLARELVEGLVAVEGVDHVVAVGEVVVQLVAVVADRVREPGQVQPLDRHPLAVVRRGEQPVHDAVVGAGRGVSDKGLGFRDGGRQAGQVEAQAADQGATVGLGSGRDRALLQLPEDKPVHRVPGRGLCGGRLGLPRRRVGPVGLIDGPLLDPAPHDLLVPRGEQVEGVGRRHHLGRVPGADPAPGLGCARLAGHDRRARAPRLVRPGHAGVVGKVHPEIRLVGLEVGPVALEARVRHDGADVAVELHRGWQRSLRRIRPCECGEESDERHNAHLDQWGIDLLGMSRSPLESKKPGISFATPPPGGTDHGIRAQRIASYPVRWAGSGASFWVATTPPPT